MKRNILIVEDKHQHMDAIYKIISDIPEIDIYKAYNEDDALKILLKRSIHVFLVDIILKAKDPGDSSGLKLVQVIRNIPKYEFTPVVFITSLEDPKMFTYSDLHCYRYIEKPFNSDFVRKTVLDLLRFPISDNNKKRIFLRNNGIILALDINDIVYIEVTRRKAKFYCIRECIEIGYKTIKQILVELDNSNFVLCNRNTIINKTFIENIDFTNRYIKLKNVSDKIEIGSIIKKSLKEELEYDNVCINDIT